MTINRRRSATAFTLLELLVVIAIIAIVAGFVAPATSTWFAGRQIPTALSELSSMLEFARTEALRRQGYTWVMIGVGSSGGRDVLSVVVVGSADNSADATVANLKPLSKRFAIENVRLTDASSLGPEVGALLPEGVESAGVPAGAAYGAYGVNHTNFVTFTPTGEALGTLQPNGQTGIPRAVDLGLVRTRDAGQPPADNAERGVIRVYGSSGRVLAARP